MERKSCERKLTAEKRITKILHEFRIFIKLMLFDVSLMFLIRHHAEQVDTFHKNADFLA